jgi:hypothetical protein
MTRILAILLACACGHTAPPARPYEAPVRGCRLSYRLERPVRSAGEEGAAEAGSWLAGAIVVHSVSEATSTVRVREIRPSALQWTVRAADGGCFTPTFSSPPPIGDAPWVDVWAPPHVDVDLAVVDSVTGFLRCGETAPVLEGLPPGEYVVTIGGIEIEGTSPAETAPASQIVR